MKGIILLTSLLFPLAALAESALEIRSISRTRSTGWVFVDNGYKRDIDLLQVRLRNGSDQPVKLESVAGYFFDGDDRRLEKIDGVSRVEISPDQYQSAPKRLAPGDQAELLYAVAPSIDSGRGKWKTFVFEAQTSGGPVRLSYPKKLDDLSHLEFGKTTGREVAAEDLEFEIESVNRYRNQRNGYVDGDYVSGLETIRARCRIDSGAEAANFFARAYFFDAEGKPVLDYREPPQVENSRGEYQTLPPRWENGEEFEVHFPIADRHTRGPQGWQSVVVVFGNEEKAVAATYPDSDMDLAPLTFKEKALVLKSREKPEQ